MLKTLPMLPPHAPASTSTAPNDPSVEAAFHAAPELMVAQILAGKLYLHARPAIPHGNVAANLGGLLFTPFKFGRGGPGGWVLIPEPELHLGPGPDKIVPDMAGWSRARMPRAVGDNPLAHYDLAPDWVCEVLSRSTRRIDQGVKMDIYAREGVRHVWHIDPRRRALDIFLLNEGRWARVNSFSQEEKIRAPPFEALELELPLLWSE